MQWVYRLLAALGIIGVFLFVATQTPLENIIFQYQGKTAVQYEVVDQFQITSDTEEIEEVLKQQKEEAENEEVSSEQVNSVQVTLEKPKYLEIPSLNVSAPIYEVGLTKNGAMATMNGPTPIAWYKYGSIPGKEGNAILAGHRDWNGVLGTLFYMETLDVGDELIITYKDGHTETFQLVSNDIYHKDRVPEHVMDLGGEARMTIITCTGDYLRSEGTYESRAVAIFKKI